MIINLISKSFYVPSYKMETSYQRLVTNPGVVGSSLSASKSTYESYDFVEYASQFTSSDFDIQSLMTVGAYDMLKPTYVSTLSSMNFADKFQNINLPKSE